MTDNKFCADYAKRGNAGCKKCKQKLDKGGLRLGKVVPNPFSDSGGDMKQWFHLGCLFDTFTRARATTKKIEEPDDIEGWDTLNDDDKELILQKIKDLSSSIKTKATPKKQGTKAPPNVVKKNVDTSLPSSSTPIKSSNVQIEDTEVDESNKDNSFREFRRLCATIAENPSYTAKTNVVSEFFKFGTNKRNFQGDLYLWTKLLLPNFVKRVYNIQSKQLIKLFSQLFGTDVEEMLTDLEQGDVAETIRVFFEKSDICPPVKKSNLSIQKVDNLLEDLSKVTKEEDQLNVLRKIAKICTGNDLKMIVRLIKHDLRINAGAKHILNGINPTAYDAFQASRDLRDVINRILHSKNSIDINGNKPGLAKTLSVRASLMTPILPMLAQACKSLTQAFQKCPNGIFAEIKYDGERVQVHKQGDNFSYFSRSLKPVLPHKISHFKEYIPKAFLHGKDIILDSEILLIDTNTGKPLPFGTLGKYKKEAFKDANVCLFVFDCIHFNGENMMTWPIKERRKVLEKQMKEVPNRIMFSEIKYISKMQELQTFAMDVFRQGLEGLVLKDSESIYEPGKRHWLKLKKDYLAEGAMADTADLVVLGAWFGTGNKGGIMSIFLMGCHDSDTNKWYTVTKVSGGHDDKTLDKLQKELEMTKISKDQNKIPDWLVISKNMVPDFVAKNPKNSQVWEITGAEFSKAEVHTAGGISIRFPRVTRIRSDKSWREATNLSELKDLFEKSKQYSSLPDLPGMSTAKKDNSDTDTSIIDDEDLEVTPKKSQQSPKGKKITDFMGRSEKRKSPPDDMDTPQKKRTKNNENAESRSELFKVSKPLPSVFKDVSLYISKEDENYDKIRRYVIAYDGDVVEDYNVGEASHVIAHPDGQIPNEKSQIAFVVTASWVWDSIIHQRAQPVQNYRPP